MKEHHARQRTALKRIETLFEQATKRPTYAKRYVQLARKISQRQKTRIPDQWRKKYCKQCNSLYNPKNSTVRIRNKQITITCKDCKAVRRFKTKR